MTIELLLLMALGMANGLLHALDADHILAVSSVALSDQPARVKVLRTALLWAVGHGLSLMVFTAIALGLGWAIPPSVSFAAELAVGVILIAVGLSIIYQLRHRHIRISHHSHDGLPAHTHLHHSDHSGRGLADHKPVLVGVVHGIAGGAPLLAVLPGLVQEQFTIAALYILLFSLCVGLAMCTFGGLLGGVVKVVNRRFSHGLRVFQGVLGVQAIGFGGYWIASAL